MGEQAERIIEDAILEATIYGESEFDAGELLAMWLAEEPWEEARAILSDLNRRAKERSHDDLADGSGDTS